MNVQWTFTERIPSRRPGWYDNISENCLATFSTMLVTVCAQNWCGLFCKDVSKFFLLSVRSFLGCLWRILPGTTLSYSSRSWMDRRNSILLFGRHSHCIRFKVKGLKHFTPPPKKNIIFFCSFGKNEILFFVSTFCPNFFGLLKKMENWKNKIRREQKVKAFGDGTKNLLSWFVNFLRKGVKISVKNK